MKPLWKNHRKIRIDKTRFSLLGLAVFYPAALYVMHSYSVEQNTLACACNDGVHYDSMLPASHPQNRCAIQSNTLDWSSWLTGKSATNQFHFLICLNYFTRNQKRTFERNGSKDITPRD